MIESTKIMFSKIDDDIIKKIGESSGGVKVAGRYFEAQYKFGKLYFVILTADETTLTLVLLNADGEIMDQEFIGHWYFDSYIKIHGSLTENFLEFQLCEKRTVCIERPSEKGNKNENVRYLKFDGFSIRD